MNTGVQRSSATPALAWTNSSPAKAEPKKDMMAIMAAHHIPYAATVSIAYPDDFMRKVARARATRGFRFMRVLASCPTGWRSEPDTGVHVARLAVQAKFDPLYEMIDGNEIVVQRPARTVAVGEYLKTQRRFAHLRADDIGAIQAKVDADWDALLARAARVDALRY